MKAFLERNKTYFETLGALGTLVFAAAAVFIAYYSYENQKDISQVQANIAARQADIAEITNRPFIRVERDIYDYANTSAVALNFLNDGGALRNLDIDVYEFLHISGNYNNSGETGYADIDLPIYGYYLVTSPTTEDSSNTLARLDPYDHGTYINSLDRELFLQREQSGYTLHLYVKSVVRLEYDTLFNEGEPEYWSVTESGYAYQLDPESGESLIESRIEYPYTYFNDLEAQTIIDYWTSVTSNKSG